jgi:hypothetical protein
VPKNFRIEGMALEIPDAPGHPNRAPFRGVLTQVDAVSDAAPAGAAGHRVLLPRDVAEAALPTLLGMAVNFAPDASSHAVRRKVGLITRAEILGDDLVVEGFLYAKDFPDVVREVRARREEMGMSYEVSGVEIEDPEAEVWVLSSVTFTGAAILEKKSAAFKRTSLAASSSGVPAGEGEGEAMEKQEVEKTVETGIRKFFSELFGKKEPAAGITAEELKASVEAAVTAAVAPLKTQLEALGAENVKLKEAAAAASKDTRRARVQAAIEAAQKAGKIVPATLAGFQAQAEVAIAWTQKVKVVQTQADKTTKEVELDPADAFIAHLEALPQVVPLEEIGAAAQRGNVIEMHFNETDHLKVDPESLALNARAEAIAADLRKQDPKLSAHQAFKQGLLRAQRERGAGARPGGITAGKV